METSLPDYAQSSACAPGSMEVRAQALRKPVIPAQAGIQGPLIELDSRLRGNDGDGGRMPASFRDTPFPGCTDSRLLPAFARMTGNDGLKETVCLSLVRHQASLPNERAGERAMEVRT